MTKVKVFTVNDSSLFFHWGRQFAEESAQTRGLKPGFARMLYLMGYQEAWREAKGTLILHGFIDTGEEGKA